jgi:hypothetical protein
MVIEDSSAEDDVHHPHLMDGIWMAGVSQYELNFRITGFLPFLELRRWAEYVHAFDLDRPGFFSDESMFPVHSPHAADIDETPSRSVQSNVLIQTGILAYDFATPGAPIAPDQVTPPRL